MEAPLHKLCGTRHWSGQPCPAVNTPIKKEPEVAKTKTQVSPSGGKRAQPAPKAKKEAGKTARKSVKPASKPIAGERAPAPDRARKKSNITATPATKPKAKKPAVKGRPRETEAGFDKQKWQREYMRGYRARKKAEREAAAAKPRRRAPAK